VDEALLRAEPPLAARALPDDVRGAVLRQRIRAALRDRGAPATATAGPGPMVPLDAVAEDAC
jgi:hypothetical protein